MSQQTKILLLDRFESDARYNCGGSLKAVFHRNSNLFLYGAAISMQGIGANAFSLSLLYKVASLKIERERNNDLSKPKGGKYYSPSLSLSLPLYF